MKTYLYYLIFALIMHPLFLLNGQDKTDEILKAYALRMDGRTDEAITVLSALLQTDPTNAMAHFEMARSLDNEKKNEHILKAQDYDPENLVYRFHLANLQMLEAYKAMKSNNTDLITKHLEQCTGTLKGILDKKPDCKETLIFLIEIYGLLPKDMGGNIDLAKTYLRNLKDVDDFYAAQGELILMSKDENFDRVQYWKDYIETHGESDAALIKLGKACLLTNAIDEAENYFIKVIENDPEQVVLYLDMARAHLYTAMRSGDPQSDALTQFKKNIKIYLNTAIDKPKLIEAWCYGWLGMVESRAGNDKLADTYIAKAEKLIPNYPRFTAIPKIDLPPNTTAYFYKSYFTPF
jgi:tetratricopeptide (TPR) repeat protein